MAKIFVNPEWITVPGSTSTEVYFSGDLVYNDSGHGGTEATCYSTFEEAYGVASGSDTIYVYNDSASPLSLAAPSGTYSQQLSDAFYIEKNLCVRAGTFRMECVENHTYSFNIIGDYMVDFGVTNSFNVAQHTVFNVWNGANFQLGSNVGSNPVSLENSGTVCVSNGATFQAGTTSITNNVEIEVTGSAFSVASVTNNGGTFKVEGTSKLEIGNLSGTITLNNENVTLNASSITGGNISATAYGAIFTGANTLNGVALNATGKTVTVGTGNSDSLTVKGTSTLNIGTLSGTIKTDANELTTLNASSITNGTISVQNSLAFTGANTLNGISLDATGKTVTVGTGNSDSLAVAGMSTLNIGNLSGTIQLAAYQGEVFIVNPTLKDSSITGGSISVTASVITVDNSTISSNVFTATDSGVDFSGTCILNGVNLDTGMLNDSRVFVSSGDTLTISGGTLRTEKLYGYGTVTVTGENELHIGNLYGDGIKLDDDATIKDSSIVGGMSGNYGGTLLVEADKTATFSGTNTMSATSINNSGTINVNGRLTTGAITNTNGTIALNGGATVSSTISGGSITTSNTGTVTVDDSTISSSAFTATADEVIFYYRNTLNGVTLDATGKAVTVNGTLTVKGTSTLNATNITGGTISAQDNLTFTGTNTLKNGVTLDATGMTTVTIGNDDGIADSLTVEGTNTLNIGTLDGTIKTDADALTTLNASSITGGGTNGGTISAQNNLAFTGANTLNGVTLDATDRTVTVNGTLTVGGMSTLNIGTLNGEIKTGSAGTTLTGSDITGGGANGGTITALGTLTFANYTDLRNITLDAHDQTVDADYSLWLGGAITLNIGTLISSILLNENTTFTNSTISNGNDSSRLYIYGGKVVTFAGANTIFDAKVHATGRITNDGSITVESNDDKGELTVYRIENSGSITVGSAGSANEAADACSLTATLLNNGGTITVNGENQSNRSLLDAAYITNGNNNYHTGKISLTNAVLNATTLTNYGRGEFDPGPPRTSQAAITISDSTVSLEKNDGTGALTNGATNNTSATIEFNNSTVTADSVTNYGIDNGTSGNTGRVGFEMTDSTFTVNNTLTNHGWFYVNNSTLQATSLVNNGDRFYVYGTSTLNIGTLTGRIDIINGNNTESLLTLNNSHITGKVNDDGSLVSRIYVSNPLTFTGTNTLTNTRFYAPYAGKTVTVDSGATLTVGGTSTLDIASLDGTILTDSAATTTLKDSSITNGTITAQNNLAFTGVNTLNRVTLNAADRTVTVGTGNFDSLTVGGTSSSLNIGTLDGTIKTGSAGTTLNASSITGGGTNGGTITVQGDLTFTGANTLNSVTLSAAGQAVTVGSGATLTINAATTVTAGSISDSGTISIEAGSTVMVTGSISGGTLNVVTKHGESSILTDDLYILVNGEIDNGVTITVDGGLPDGLNYVDRTTDLSIYGTGYVLTTLNGTGLFLKKEIASDLVVSSEYAELEDGTITSDGHLVGYNAFATIQKAVEAGGGADDIFVEDGKSSEDEVTSFEGIKAEIAGGEYSGYVMNGKIIDSDKIVTGEIDMTVSGGDYKKLFSAGDYVGKTDGTFTGSYSAIRCGGYDTDTNDDPVSFTATTVSLKIEGGVFEKNVSGGIAYMSTEAGSAKLYANVTVDITGGEFQQYLYAGSISKGKTGSEYTQTYGDVRININATTNKITLNKIACGSYNNGWIYGTTGLTLSGLGSQLDFIAGGEIWGGCGGDYYYWSDTEARSFKSHVRVAEDSDVIGTRTLTFSGFTGTLDSDCARIRGFSDMEIVDDSEVTLGAGSISLSDIENWTFENGSSLSGNFSNDFTGDTLSLTLAEGESAFTNGWELLTDTNTGSGDTKNVFNGFAAFADGGVKLNGVSADGYSDGIGWYWGASASPTARLCLEETGSQTSMVLHLA